MKVSIIYTGQTNCYRGATFARALRGATYATGAGADRGATNRGRGATNRGRGATQATGEGATAGAGGSGKVVIRYRFQ